MGGKKNAIWRVVVADRRSPRDGRFIEMIGHYNPQTHPSQIVIDEERLQHWLERGAEPTNTVKKLMRAQASGGAATAEAEAPAGADAAEVDPEGGAAAESMSGGDSEPAAEGDTAVEAEVAAEADEGATAEADAPPEGPDDAGAAPEGDAESS